MTEPSESEGTPPGGEGPTGRRLPGLRRKETVPAEPLRLSDLPPRQRRLAVIRSAAIVLVAWAVIFGAYYVLPFGDRSGPRVVLRLCADMGLVAAVFVWQIRRISVAELPELRAVEALGIVIALFLAAFSGVYLTMSHHLASNFSIPLNQTKALYFTITVFSTVGFGDITPQKDPTRMLVAAQMLLDLVIIGAVVQVLFNAARNRVGPSGSTGRG